jgi:hypothetical protein
LPVAREHDAFDLSRFALKIMGGERIVDLKFGVFLGVRCVTQSSRNVRKSESHGEVPVALILVKYGRNISLHKAMFGDEAEIYICYCRATVQTGATTSFRKERTTMFSRGGSSRLARLA